MDPPAHKKRRLSPQPTVDLENETSDEEISVQSTQESHAVGKSIHRSKPNPPRAENGPALSNYGVYHTNLFQLQLNELLSTVRPDYGRRMVKAENALRKLKTIIERIPDRGAKLIPQAEREQTKSHHVRIPFPAPRPDKKAKYTLAYSKPANINVVGSYARKMAIQVGDRLGIDLAVTMPTSLFQEKDYLNYRYFHKRAYYLACIATGIAEDEDNHFAITFAYQNDSKLQPIILVSPGQGADDFSKLNCQIRIILGVDGALFPVSRTFPDKNCIRAKADRASSQGNLGAPTSFYNASLRSECSSLAYLKYLHGASLQSDAFTDACVLGSVWLRQRGLGTGLSNGGFGSFEWSCTVALLMQGGGLKGKPVLSRGYNSYQLFKATLQYISTKDLIASPVFVHSDGTSAIIKNEPALFDGGRGMNVLFKMTPWSYAMLRHEACHTLKLLSDPLSVQFDACFITRINDPLQRFDCVVSLPISRLRSSSTDAIDNDIEFCHQTYQALKAGLNDRINLLYLKPPEKNALPLAESIKSTKETQVVQIGLLLNPEHINRSVDRGPSAEDKKAAAKFRKFWGGKAELRRFKDGSIQESLIWSASDAQNSVLIQIVTYVIRRHIGDEAAGAIEFVGQSFDHLLPNQKAATSDPLAIYQPALDAFGALEKEIRSLEGLPLQARQISAANAQLRSASTKAPILNPTLCQMEPADICIQFEGSSRWPDDLIAVQRTKIAFLLKMGELLEESTTGLSARLGLENANHKLLNAAFLDIIYPSGAFFRLRIHHERELNLLERVLKDKSHTAASREETATALSTYKRNFIQAPLHTQAVRTLSTRFPLLSPSMRLMKRWRDSHLLCGHISDELIELLIIRTFVHPYPWSVPGSVMTGFLRTLTFISKWDWRSAPLIVDFNGEMNTTDIDAINLRFEAWRKIDPAMNRVAMFAASNIDPGGITWTELGPSKVVAARFTSLAKIACALIKEQGLRVEPQALFAAAMSDFDFVIHLSKKFVGDKQGRETAGQPVFKNMQVQGQEDKSLVGFNPVQSYLEELRTRYNSNVIFFYDEQGGSAIAGLWNPQTGPRPWKVNLQYSTMPIVQPGDEEAQVSINKSATLHDISRLGADMVSRVEVKR